MRDRPIGEIDRALHAARMARPYARMLVAELPDGAMIRHASEPWLLWRGMLHRWTSAGYEPGVRANALPPRVDVLTSAPMLAALRGGYRPLVHPSVAVKPGSERML